METIANYEVALEAEAQLGEGVSWDAGKQVLYWVDILSHEVHIYNPQTGVDRCITVGQYVGAVVPTVQGDLMLAMHHGFARLDPATEELTPVADPESDRPENRFNDGKCDPAGRFWAGTMHVEGKGATGALYRLAGDLTVRKLFGDVGISNGLAWSPDHQTLYYIDTRKRDVAAFECDLATGELGDRRSVITFTPDRGHPDGMTIDAEGMLWIAFCGGGRIMRWDPVTAKPIAEIRLPVTLTTNCVFGGRRLDTLYVSSGRFGLTGEELAAQPQAGALFAAKPGVCGIAAVPFSG